MDRTKLAEGALQVVIDENIVIFWPAQNFIARFVKPRLDNVPPVFGAAFEPCTQFLHRGWQYKDPHGVRSAFVFDLPRSLVIDVEEHVAPLGEDLFRRLARRAVKIPMDL